MQMSLMEPFHVEASAFCGCKVRASLSDLFTNQSHRCISSSFILIPWITAQMESLQERNYVTVGAEERVQSDMLWDMIIL